MPQSLRIPSATAAQKYRKLPSSVIVFKTFVPGTFFQLGEVHLVSHMLDKFAYNIPVGLRSPTHHIHSLDSSFPGPILHHRRTETH
jgi:hypothetical protein